MAAIEFKDPITAGIGLVDTFINKFVGDKDLAVKLMAEARSEEFQGDLKLLLGQMDINKVEAANPNLFVSGWRPAVGWTCVCALFYNFIIYRFLQFIVLCLLIFKPEVKIPEFPVLEVGELMTLLLGLLGLSTQRTYEKVKGTARDGMKD